MPVHQFRRVGIVDHVNWYRLAFAHAQHRPGRRAVVADGGKNVRRVQLDRHWRNAKRVIGLAHRARPGVIGMPPARRIACAAICALDPAPATQPAPALPDQCHPAEFSRFAPDSQFCPSADSRILPASSHAFRRRDKAACRYIASPPATNDWPVSSITALRYQPFSRAAPLRGGPDEALHRSHS